MIWHSKVVSLNISDLNSEVLINGKFIINSHYILIRLLGLPAIFQISLPARLVLASLAVAVGSALFPIASTGAVWSLALVLLAIAWEKISTIVPSLKIGPLHYHRLKGKGAVTFVEQYFLTPLSVGLEVTAEITGAVEARTPEFEAQAVHIKTSRALAFATSVVFLHDAWLWSLLREFLFEFLSHNPIKWA